MNIVNSLTIHLSGLTIY